MRYILLFLSLVIFAPFATPASLSSSEKHWLGCAPADRFSALTRLSFQSLPGYSEQLVPYLIARGVPDDKTMEDLIHEDFFNLAQALSLLFESDSTCVLQRLLGEHFSLIEGSNPQIDHVGRELYGPLSFYLPLLSQIASQLGLIHQHAIVFPSTQVVKVLQQHDPSLKGVTIGRVYFQSLDQGKRGCLELFQASPQDEKNPQNVEATIQRLSLLTKSADPSSIIPIDHLSIELNSVAEVQRIHERIHNLASNTLIPNQKEVSHNPGDGSTQTKAVMRDSIEAPFNKIVEFVHYEG